MIRWHPTIFNNFNIKHGYWCRKYTHFYVLDFEPLSHFRPITTANLRWWSWQPEDMWSCKTGNFALLKFLVSQTDDKWQLRQFLTHVTTFHDLCTTLMTYGDNILTTPKTNGEDTLTTPVTSHDYGTLWLPCMMSLMTLVMTLILMTLSN